MESLVEIVFRSIIVNVIGVYTRYFFFKAIGKKKTVEYLVGGKQLDVNGMSQGFVNVLVGLITFFIISVTIAYLVLS